MTRRAGVFVCHCGNNIAATVDVKQVAEELAKDEGVVFSKDYVYMCSDPGQQSIIDAIKEHKLDSVVISCCSPNLHEKTFRDASAAGRHEPVPAGDRQHPRAMRLGAQGQGQGAPRRRSRSRARRCSASRRNEALTPIGVPVTRKVMVIGGGIAGIQSALDLANAGLEVVLVEKLPTIGGHMIQLSETFPTLDCSQCILSPKMVEVSKHPKITLMINSEVKAVSGFVGNFKVKIHTKAQYVDPEKCKICDDCTHVCPVVVPNEYDVGLTGRRAIHIPFAQAIPASYYLDADACLGLNPVVCGKCKDACEAGAINYDVKPKTTEIDVGAIVVATGFDLYGQDKMAEYGRGKYAGRARRHPVRAAVLGIRPDRRTRAAAVRSQGAEERRLHPVLRLARSRAALRLLLEDLLHVHGQARHAVQAPRPRRQRLRLLHRHPLRR